MIEIGNPGSMEIPFSGFGNPVGNPSRYGLNDSGGKIILHTTNHYLCSCIRVLFSNSKH